jgi:hypothetical protein
MATSEAFTAGLIIVLPLLPVLGIRGAICQLLGDCWRRQLKQKALRQAIEAELAANQARGTAEDANVAGGFPPA